MQGKIHRSENYLRDSERDKQLSSTLKKNLRDNKRSAVTEKLLKVQNDFKRQLNILGCTATMDLEIIVVL